MNHHADISPSGFYRLQECAGSWGLEQTVDRLPTTIHSAYGTAAHNIAANVLATGLNAKDFIGSKQKVEGFELTVDEEMATYIQIYVDAVKKELDEKQ